MAGFWRSSPGHFEMVKWGQTPLKLDALFPEKTAKTFFVTTIWLMKKPSPLIDAEGEVRTLTAADLSTFRPASDALPPSLQKTLGMRQRGPQRSPTKVSTTIRLSSDVLQAFRATGDGWQTRVDAALKDWLKTHSPT
jgi:uncharacterized protein (DUF4415 family)